PAIAAGEKRGHAGVALVDDDLQRRLVDVGLGERMIRGNEACNDDGAEDDPLAAPDQPEIIAEVEAALLLLLHHRHRHMAELLSVAATADRRERLRPARER